MRTKILVAMLLMLALPAMAQNKGSQADLVRQTERLTGIWQHCILVHSKDGGVQPVFRSQFKVLNSDGTFCNLWQAASKAPAALFATGKWHVTSDSTFVEHLSTIATDRGAEGKDNELFFRLVTEDNILQISYTMPGDSRRYQELWVRVQKGVPQEVAREYFQNNPIVSGK